MAQKYKTEAEVPRPGALGGGHWKLSKLTGITLLFGKNGSGKSQLLRALRDTSPQTTHYVVPERGGDIGFEASFLTQQMDAEQRKSNSSTNFVQQYRQQIIGRIQAYMAVRGNFRGDAKPPADPAVIEAQLSELLPDFSMTLSASSVPPYQLTRDSDGAKVDNASQLSSGEVQMLTLAIDILTIAAIWEVQNTKERVLLVDEPDAHIHPDLQARFADFLVRVTDEYKLQVFLATHSTTLLAAVGQFATEDASIIYLDRIRSEFTANPFSAVLRELTSCLGGHALMGPLFGMPILLVEGEDDYRIWSQVPRHHQVSFAVIPCGGEEIKNHQKQLERIFSALRSDAKSPAGFALLDDDKGKPKPSKDNPQDHVRFIQLNCHEAENLYLCDETLALLDLKWEGAIAKIRDAAPKHGEKQAMLEKAAEWDRRTVDIKRVIEEISQALDDKGVHWTRRVGKAIGNGRPEGQLAEFLGKEVIESLWRT